MNIEQLERGQKLQKEIKDFNQTQTELIENYKKYTEENRYNGSTKGISISFQAKETHKVISIVMDDMARQEVFNLINNYIMRKITEKETEFSNL